VGLGGWRIDLCVQRQIFLDDQTCSTHGGDKIVCTVLILKPNGKSPLVRRRYR
jgi:hypothetical protein